MRNQPTETEIANCNLGDETPASMILHARYYDADIGDSRKRTMETVVRELLDAGALVKMVYADQSKPASDTCYQSGEADGWIIVPLANASYRNVFVEYVLDGRLWRATVHQWRPLYAGVRPYGRDDRKAPGGTVELAAA